MFKVLKTPVAMVLAGAIAGYLLLLILPGMAKRISREPDGIAQASPNQTKNKVLLAQAGGLNWKSSLAEALSEGKQNKKFVFADVYTDWCGWCKVLDKKTFSDASMIEYFNKNFVIAKLNGENAEGKEAVKKYDIQGFPCGLVFDAEGNFKGKVMGFKTAPQYQEALNKLTGQSSTVSSTTGAEATGSAELSWGKSLDAAIKEAAGKQKHVFADVYTDWCGWCKVLDRKTFANPEMAKFLDSKFVLVKLNAEDKGEGSQAASKYQVSGYPCGLVLNSEGKLLGKISGFREPAQYQEALTNTINGKPESDDE